MNRVAVYTATIGRYEAPADVSSIKGTRAPDKDRIGYYRFTDADASHSNADELIRSANPSWNHVNEKPRFESDSIRSARAIKILGHKLLADYDATVWIDNRVRLKVPVNELVERFLLPGVDVALPLHSYHRSLIEEFRAVVDGRFDDPRRVREQREAYDKELPHLFSERVYWTAILIRRNNAIVNEMNTIWWEQVLRYSRRDQLSFPYACAAVPKIAVNAFPLDNFDSDIHEWRKMSDVGRQPGAGHWTPASVKSELLDTAGFLKEELKRKGAVRREGFRLFRRGGN